ncbi:MAG TPA: AraC family transcriptional regulator [Chitinophagales bacterium]|nr:AraC family transcriptional regulator [Chitinophagales bacterium]
MVCPRCIKAVTDTITQMGYNLQSVALGEAIIGQAISPNEFASINIALQQIGFELVLDRELQMVARIKAAVIDMIHYDQNDQHIKNSSFLAQKLATSYSHLSKLFSRYEKITLERYIILQKIERAKELISYGDKTLSEIANRLEYSSVQHLSNQFKSVVGMSVTDYKKIDLKDRLPLTEVGQSE